MGPGSEIGDTYTETESTISTHVSDGGHLPWDL